jgi:hypothetical protein
MAAQRPGVLTTVCVIGIVLGALGVMGGGFGMVAILGQAPLQGLQEQQLEQLERQAGGAAGDQIARQREFQNTLNELQARWLPVTLSLNGLNFFLSVLLVTGAILCLGLKRRGPLVFTIAAAGLMLADTANAAFSGFMSMETMDITKEFMSATLDDAAFHQPGAPDMGGFMESFMGAAAIGGIVFAAVWWMIKLGYYVWSLRVLRRPNIRELFTA